VEHGPEVRYGHRAALDLGELGRDVLTFDDRLSLGFKLLDMAGDGE
jgi:hypothetical protein